MKLQELLDLLRKAKAEDRAALLEEHASVYTDLGLTAEQISSLAVDSTAVTTEAKPADTVEPKPEEKEGELVTAGATLTESLREAERPATFQRGSLQGNAILREAVKAAGLPVEFEVDVARDLPARFTEADATGRVESIKRLAEGIEARGMRPGVAHVEVKEEDRDNRSAKLLESLRGNYQGGYSSITEAFRDITGQPYTSREEMARTIVRESWAAQGYSGQRLRESITTTGWGEVLADAMNRRILEVFNGNWSDWKQIVNIVPVNDFRSQKLIQVSEYSTLPTVAEGGAYQPLTSPTDKQETYTPTKKGGTDSFTYEAARNDDLRVLASIPTRLGRLVAYTIYSTVFGVFTANPTMGDSVALFNAGHGNTTASTTLSNAGLNTLRGKMRDQVAYGDTGRALGITPSFLLVPNELEDLANQLCNGERAVPSTTPGATDVPNLHRGLKPIVVDIWTDANDYFLSCDPSVHPTIEVGFLDGKVDPEIFVQDDEKTGTPFSSDEVTFKVRSTWGYAAADYKGLQRMTN